MTAGKFDGTFDGIRFNCKKYRQIALVNTQVKKAKSRADDFKMADGGGMYLLVKRNGHKYWRLDYRFRGKRKTLALGVYPQVGLKDAREKRRQAKACLNGTLVSTAEQN